MQTVATTTERRRPGRPRKGEVSSPMKAIHFLCTQEAVEIINQLTARLGMTQSEVLEYAARQLAKAA